MTVSFLEANGLDFVLGKDREGIDPVERRRSEG